MKSILSQKRWLCSTSMRLCAGTVLDVSKPLLQCTPVTKTRHHDAVLLTEAIEALIGTSSDESCKHFIDGTFGRGGHCRALLAKLPSESRVVAFDVDRIAERQARKLEQEDSRLTFHREWAHNFPRSVDGVLLDLGISTDQLFGGRGFSFSHDDVLDLRFDRSQGYPAWQVLCKMDVDQLTQALYYFGEDDDWLLCQRLAIEILHARSRPPRTSREFADAVDRVKKFDDRGQHPAKLALQALRMFTNRELFHSFQALRAGASALRVGGRLVVLAYKRKEVALVKRLLREHEHDCDNPVNPSPPHPKMTGIFKLPSLRLEQVCAPVRPSMQEVIRNHRSRAAQMWVLEVIASSDGSARSIKTTDFAIARAIH